MDGYAVTRKIKTIRALAGIPIVAVTSYAMMGDREKAMAAGCSGYIEKPINPETFTEQIREFLPGNTAGKEGDFMYRCLIVDDQEQNRYLFQTILKGNGYEVESAVNGAEALEKARRHPPDLVISDILMPVMDGFTLCRQWRQDDRLKKNPLYFLHCHLHGQEGRSLRPSLGADRFLVKPLDPEVLIKEIAAVIRDKDGGVKASAEKRSCRRRPL